MMRENCGGIAPDFRGVARVIIRIIAISVEWRRAGRLFRA